jgi:drug/metabolite transporter (DMT)-like permease
MIAVALPPNRFLASRDASRLFGILSAVGAVTIWAAWIVATRRAVTHDLDAWALGFLRFAVPAIVFAPVWWRTGIRPAGLTPSIGLSLLGAGAPFFIIVAIAMRHAAAAEIGPLLPGTMPLIVTALSVRLLGERLNLSRNVGAGLVLAGIVAIAAEGIDAGSAAWPSHFLLLVGAFMWAAYTVGLKKSNLTSLEATALVSIWSAVLLAPFGVLSLLTAMHSGQAGALVLQAVIQGVLSGVVAILLYGVAITRLGATTGSAFVALVPGLAALIAVPVLGEVPSTIVVAGIVLSAVGVGLLTGGVSAAMIGKRPPVPILATR